MVNFFLRLRFSTNEQCLNKKRGNGYALKKVVIFIKYILYFLLLLKNGSNFIRPVKESYYECGIKR